LANCGPKLVLQMDPGATYAQYRRPEVWENHVGRPKSDRRSADTIVRLGCRCLFPSEVGVVVFTASAGWTQAPALLESLE
jgi:hypothetical protein